MSSFPQVTQCSPRRFDVLLFNSKWETRHTFCVFPFLGGLYLPIRNRTLLNTVDLKGIRNLMFIGTCVILIVE